MLRGTPNVGRGAIATSTRSHITLTLPIALMTLIATADALSGHTLVLTGLIAIAPLVAVATCRRRAVVVIALLSTVVAVILGWPDHDLIAQRHLVTIFLVATVGLISIRLVILWQHTQLAATQNLHDATHDPLTGVFNRRGFNDIFETLLHIRAPERPPMALALVDVDNLKAINDRWGHAVGDTAIRLVARELSAYVREADIVARLGGDEFAVVLVGTDRASAARTLSRAAQRIRLSLLPPPAPAHVTISAGIAHVQDDDSDGAAVFGRSDRALYAAKGHGRDQCLAFSDLTRPANATAHTSR